MDGRLMVSVDGRRVDPAEAAAVVGRLLGEAVDRGEVDAATVDQDGLAADGDVHTCRRRRTELVQTFADAARVDPVTCAWVEVTERLPAPNQHVLFVLERVYLNKFDRTPLKGVWLADRGVFVERPLSESTYDPDDWLPEEVAIWMPAPAIVGTRAQCAEEEATAAAALRGEDVGGPRFVGRFSRRR